MPLRFGTKNEKSATHVALFVSVSL